MKHVSLVHINAEDRMGVYSEQFSKMAVFLCLMFNVEFKVEIYGTAMQNAAITIFCRNRYFYISHNMHPWPC